MILHQFPGEIPDLLRWAVNRGHSKREAQQPPEPFRSWVVELLPADQRAPVGFWVGVTTPESKCDGEWVDRFPHRHVDSMGWPAEAATVMTYLSIPEEGGEICVGGLSRDDEYECIKPSLGMTLVVDSLTWHGVRPVIRGSRIVLLTTGMPT